jgi:hypothetical protein
MDVTGAVSAGLPWRRFYVLLSGLSPDAVYRHMLASRAATYTAENAHDYFSRFPKAGD